MMTVFCEYSYGTFDSKVLTQGNKITLIKSLKNYIKQINYGIFTSTCGMILLVSLNLLEIFLRLRREMHKKSLNIIYNNEKTLCSRCKLNTINVALLVCNHFNICESCFIKNNRKCHFCQSIEQMDYLIFNN